MLSITKVIIGGVLLSLALVAPAMAGGDSDTSAVGSCHDNCTILVQSDSQFYADKSDPTTCHDGCTWSHTTNPDDVSCHDNCKIIYEPGASPGHRNGRMP